MQSFAPAVRLSLAAVLVLAPVGCDRPASPAGAPPSASAQVAAPAAAPAAPAAPPVPVAPQATPALGADRGPAPAGAQAGAVQDELPPIRLSPSVLDLGFMAPRAGGKGTVTLTNVGQSPLTIAAVTPSCKCTTTSALAGKVIAPGASETFEAVLEGASMPQTHRAVIKIAVEGYA